VKNDEGPVQNRQILQIQNISFSYGERLVLDRVDLCLNRGEILGLVGPNGAGKSTLFRCILALERKFSGDIKLDGESVKRKPPEDLAVRIAYVPQFHYPSFNYTVRDMVLMGTTAQTKAWAMPGKKQIERAEEALERTGIAHLGERGYRQLSGGEQQLVLIARALAQKADVLVMDEPTANLDYGNQIRVLARIKDLSRHEYSIIFSTHNPDHAFLFTDRAAALYGNRIIACGRPHEVLTPELIELLYRIKVTIRCDEKGLFYCVPVV
jgi:iron complex transport system ATP-binding protein